MHIIVKNTARDIFSGKVQAERLMLSKLSLLWFYKKNENVKSQAVLSVDSANHSKSQLYSEVF